MNKNTSPMYRMPLMALVMSAHAWGWDAIKTPWVGGYEETECRIVEGSRTRLSYEYFYFDSCSKSSKRRGTLTVQDAAGHPDCYIRIGTTGPAETSLRVSFSELPWVSGGTNGQSGDHFPEGPLKLNGVSLGMNNWYEINNSNGSEQCKVVAALDDTSAVTVIGVGPRRVATIGDSYGQVFISGEDVRDGAFLKMQITDDVGKTVLDTGAKYVGPQKQYGLQVEAEGTAVGALRGETLTWGPHRINVSAKTTLVNGWWGVGRDYNVAGVKIRATPSDKSIALSLNSGGTWGGAGEAVERTGIDSDNWFGMMARRGTQELQPGAYESTITLVISMP